MNFQRVFEDAPEVSLLLDDSGKVLAASDRYLHAVGRARAQVLGRSLFELPPYATAPDAVAQLRTALAALGSSGVVAPHDLPGAEPCVSGAHFLSATNVPIRDREGGLLCIQHQMQSAPPASRARPDRETELRKLFESSFDAIALVDAYGRFLFVTPSIRNVLGYSEEEYIAAPPMALVHPEDVPRFGAEINQLFTQPGGLMLVRVRERHRDGTFRTLEGACVNRLNDPDVAAVIVTFRDVTEHVHLQDELRRSHEQLRVALSAAHAMSWTWDIERHQYAYSDDFETFFGLPKGNHQGRDEAVQAVHPDDREMVRRQAQRCLETDEDFKVEFRGPGEGQQTRWYASHGRVFRDASGRPVQMVGISWDITTRKTMEREREVLDRRIQEGQKLESLGVLAGGIAHDFNNILTAILGNASLAQSSLDKDCSARPFVDQIEEAARRAAELCRQMLAYAGKGRFVLALCDLNELIEETTHLLQVSISKKAELRFHLQANLPLVVADATQIRQVLMNFVINASDAVGERGGLISISTGVVRADRAYLDTILLGAGLPEGAYAYLEVSDTGRGMSAETQTRIFEPFFSTKFTGRGLGLAAVLGIVRGHKGALKVYSEEGKGSTFKFLLPASPEKREPAPEARSDTAAAIRGTILLVDDEESVRAVAGTMLDRLGFKVLTASDGREAVDLFRARGSEIVAVLMDLTMPLLDGEEAFGELRQIDPSIRILLMSGYNEQDAIARFVGKGLAGFIQKPFGLEDLRGRLRALLG